MFQQSKIQMAKGGFLACVVIVGICIGGTVANDSSLLQTFEERLANLSDEAKGLAQKYADINTRIHQLQTEYYTLKGHDVPDRQLQKRSFEYYHYGSTVPTEEIQLSEGSKTKVEFSVRLQHGLSSLRTNEIIPMDKVITNNGNGYDPSTGVFTCPTAGTYALFSKIFVSYRSADSWTEYSLVLNNQPISWLWTEHTGISHAATASDSDMVVVNLEVGDKVWLKTNNMHLDQYHVLVVNENHTSFSGFMIHDNL